MRLFYDLIEILLKFFAFLEEKIICLRKSLALYFLKYILPVTAQKAVSYFGPLAINSLSMLHDRGRLIYKAEPSSVEALVVLGDVRNDYLEEASCPVIQKNYVSDKYLEQPFIVAVCLGEDWEEIYRNNSSIRTLCEKLDAKGFLDDAVERKKNASDAMLAVCAQKQKKQAKASINQAINQQKGLKDKNSYPQKKSGLGLSGSIGSMIGGAVPSFNAAQSFKKQTFGGVFNEVSSHKSSLQKQNRQNKMGPDQMPVGNSNIFLASGAKSYEKVRNNKTMSDREALAKKIARLVDENGVDSPRGGYDGKLEGRNNSTYHRVGFSYPTTLDGEVNVYNTRFVLIWWEATWEGPLEGEHKWVFNNADRALTFFKKAFIDLEFEEAMYVPTKDQVAEGETTDSLRRARQEGQPTPPKSDYHNEQGAPSSAQIREGVYSENANKSAGTLEEIK